MPVVPLPQPRHTLEERDGALRVTIRSRRSRLTGLALLWPALAVTLFACLVVVSLAAGPTGQATRPALPPPPTASPAATPPGRSISPAEELLCGVALFSLFGVMMTAMAIQYVYHVAWHFTGREEIVVTPGTLALARRAARLGRTREYPAASVTALRVVPRDPRVADRGVWPWPQPQGTTGTLAFDYGPQTVYFGEDLDEAEAKQILAAIVRRAPQFGPR